MTGAPLTYDELVALAYRLEADAGIYVEPTDIERLAAYRVPVARRGVTQLGMEWTSVA